MTIKQKDLKPITEAEFSKAIKEVLLSKPIKKASYENKRPTKQELNTKWKLIKNDE